MGKSKSKQQKVPTPQGKAVDLSMALLIKDNSLESGKPNLLALIKLNWPAIINATNSIGGWLFLPNRLNIISFDIIVLSHNN
jgi:hypothetical protein